MAATRMAQMPEKGKDHLKCFSVSITKDERELGLFVPISSGTKIKRTSVSEGSVWSRNGEVLKIGKWEMVFHSPLPTV